VEDFVQTLEDIVASDRGNFRIKIGIGAIFHHQFATLEANFHAHRRSVIANAAAYTTTTTTTAEPDTLRSRKQVRGQCRPPLWKVSQD
jgi:hypothetical protein